MKVVIATSGNLGRNFRLLRMAKAISSDSSSFVHLIGGENYGIPKELERATNVRLWRLPLCNLAFPLNIIFGFLNFIWRCASLLCYLAAIRDAHFVVCSTYDSLLDPILFYIVKSILRAKFVIDIAPYAYGCVSRSSIFSIIERRVPKLGDVRIVSTKAMQSMLRLQSLTSVLIRDAPGTQFKPRPLMRTQVCELLGIDANAMIISIPVPEMTADRMSQFLSIAKSMDSITPGPVALAVFCGGKVKVGIEKACENQNFRHLRLYIFSMNSEIYWNILGVSDLGICFNGSLAGLDISPHLLELAASGIPILAFKFGCVSEVVKNGENGFLFRTDEDLLKILQKIILEKSINIIDMTHNARDFRVTIDNDWLKPFHKKQKPD